MMIDKDGIDAALDQVLAGVGDKRRLLMPPPVFTTMQGEFIGFDRENKILQARFPVLAEQLNPYGSMQGGMIAAAIDNTLGPLSMLVAPPNFTRRLEIKYRRPVTPGLDYITVIGKFLDQKKRQLFFRASVVDGDGNELANGKAVHWVLDDDQL
ncbi:MAG: PaaI family thioesterase [Thermodesulfobacteriota bacterium]